VTNPAIDAATSGYRRSAAARFMPRIAIGNGRQAQAAKLGYDPGRMTEPAIDWQAQDWEDLVPRLLLLAMSRLRRMTWRGDRRGPPPGASEAEDFVNDAISKTIAGLRVWNPAACTLFQHLAGVIVSDISHAAESSENRLTLRATADDLDDGPAFDIGDEVPDQETVALWRSEQRQLLEHLERIDMGLRRMAELMLVEDMQETVDLSRALGIPPTEVANRRKRLKRAVRGYLMEFAA
jgi:DNA-directed RNA polymerase specialized sigma24 family protein